MDATVLQYSHKIKFNDMSTPKAKKQICSNGCKNKKAGKNE